MKKYHYTYILEYSTKLLYHGVRSCDCSIEDDLYYGSSAYTPTDEIPTKTILSRHRTRKAAMKAEIKYHKLHDVGSNNQYYNRSNQTSTGFDTAGIPKSDETRAKMSAAHIGIGSGVYHWTWIALTCG